MWEREVQPPNLTRVLPGHEPRLLLVANQACSVFHSITKQKAPLGKDVWNQYAPTSPFCFSELSFSNNNIHQKVPTSCTVIPIYQHPTHWDFTAELASWYVGHLSFRRLLYCWVLLRGIVLSAACRQYERKVWEKMIVLWWKGGIWVENWVSRTDNVKEKSWEGKIWMPCGHPDNLS